MELKDLLKEIERNFTENDKRMGPLFLLSVLSEEVGELNRAIRYYENIEEEISDVIFITLSIANLYGINPENKIKEKYLKDPNKIKNKWKDIY
ncbi:MAG: MazG nucleotide pyrophosphohydrolase domain-containing protein [Thermoplasmata archaeon]|jgi:NTP pyrophosphatase (non-canonical NTP hydrolase)|nr:nucleotide pyrophosphohydrolase [Thermoplasmata archaeon]MVT13064.1 nucleotide pyrophosphohydrolase [Euryarchaeota archaeon]MVT14505.1 nucleotide pyrophosphohydrolase [Euryarchaeota archaeon]MVT35878.1 nucleotide pyrophosphohydrolase [Euryarchaeota archaeon]